MKILLYADSPTCTTGFGIVSKNIIKELIKELPEAEIEILGINERGDHHELRHNSRITINPAYDMREPHGRLKLVKTMSQGGYDHIIIIHDLITVLQPIDHNGASIATAIENLKPFYPDTKYHLYYPIDSEFEDEANFEEYKKIQVFDSLIPYTEFAKNQLSKALKNIKANFTEPMYHGVNTKEFYPLSRQQKKQLRKELFGIEDKRPVISIIARNQWRKDIAMSIHTFKELKKLIPDAFLYIHSKPQDVGGDFRRYLAIWNIKDYKIVSELDVANGVPTDKLNEIYNASDLILSSAHGEGFGLPYIEAMATKTAVMAPATGVEQEILPTEYVHQYTHKLYESSGQDGTPFRRTFVSQPEMVAIEIQKLLNHKDLPRIKDEALERVKKDFDWNKNVKILIDRLYWQSLTTS